MREGWCTPGARAHLGGAELVVEGLVRRKLGWARGRPVVLLLGECCGALGQPLDKVAVAVRAPQLLRPRVARGVELGGACVAEVGHLIIALDLLALGVVEVVVRHPRVVVVPVGGVAEGGGALHRGGAE